MGPIVIGVDVGQKVDPTAIAVVQIETRAAPERPQPARQQRLSEFVATEVSYEIRLQQSADAWGVTPVPASVLNFSHLRQEEHYIVRHIRRLELGTPYPEVARILCGVVQGVQQRSDELYSVYIDATGVGQPVVDVIKAAGLGVRIVPVYFTYGDRRIVDEMGIRLGKGWLVSKLQVLLQCSRLHLPATDEANALAKELMDYEIKVSEKGNDTFGAFKVGTHDDMVTALGLCVQEVPSKGVY